MYIYYNNYNICNIIDSIIIYPAINLPNTIAVIVIIHQLIVVEINRWSYYYYYYYYRNRSSVCNFEIVTNFNSHSNLRTESTGQWSILQSFIDYQLHVNPDRQLNKRSVSLLFNNISTGSDIVPYTTVLRFGHSLRSALTSRRREKNQRLK